MIFVRHTLYKEVLSVHRATENSVIKWHVKGNVYITKLSVVMLLDINVVKYVSYL